MTDLLPAVEIETGPSPKASVIWLHGLGADGHDFEPIVPELGIPPERPVRFVFPHAPERPVTLNAGMVMRAWYDIVDLSDRNIDEDGIRASAAEVTKLLDAEKARGAERIVLAGFSMGGALAYHVGLRHPEPLAGLCILSAYLLLESELPAEASDANRSTPVLACHGSYDPLVPVELGERAQQVVQKNGNPVEWKTYPTAHSVHPDEVAEVGRWMVERLGRES